MIPSRATGKRILLVDDDFATREAVASILAGDGHMVAAAANGEEALERLHHSGRPDLILLDLAMPKMDGWNLHDHLQADVSTAKIPIVVLSAVDEAPEAASLGAAGYLHKPVETAKLLEVVRRCCG
jgi:CheY-like chemotaxis protein